jgi:hypothetical protein
MKPITLAGAAMLVAAAACRSNGNAAPDTGAPATGAAPAAAAAATPAAASAAASATADTSAGVASPATGSVPASIDAIGHHGENAYDMVKAGNWIAARASADSLRPLVDSLPASATIALRELNQAIANKDQRTALRASNRLTQLGALLSEPYHPAVPAAVMLLDFDGRELEIWAAAADRTRLRETASAMRRTWNAVRPSVEARGGRTEAASFDALVARVESAVTPADYARLATPVLDAVDTLEQVFTR